jgi:photosystem II stability/assembly factor-like uncharacterized protein
MASLSDLALGVAMVMIGASRKPAGFRAAMFVAVLVVVATVLSPAVASASPSVGVLGPWKSQHVPKGLDHLVLNGASCSGTGKDCETGGMFCPVGGCGGLIPSGVLVTGNGGTTWRRSSLPKNIGDLSAITCPGATRCIATANRGPLGDVAPVFLVTGNAGKTWAVVKSPGGAEPEAIACLSAAHCIAVGYVSGGHGAIVTTTNDGRSWKSLPVPTGITEIGKISCGSSFRCVATGFSSSGLAFVYTKNGGTSWTKVPAPSTMGNLVSISCPSSTKCLVGGLNTAQTAGMIAVTSNGGATWTTRAVAAGVIQVDGVSCQSTSRCAAVVETKSGFQNIIATTNGGAKWSKDRLPAGKRSLLSVSCTHSGRCLAVGEFLTFSHGAATDNGPLILAS